MNTFVALDFETANHLPTSVCSMGLVFVENGSIVDRFYDIMRPFPNYYNYRNSEVHGMFYEDTVFAKDFPEIWSQVAERVKNLPIVAHNSRFDEGCLRAVLKAYHLPEPENDFLCTYRATKRQYSGLKNYKLNTVAAYFGYNLTHHHHALADAEACAHIALHVF